MQIRLSPREEAELEAAAARAGATLGSWMRALALARSQRRRSPDPAR